MCKVREEEWKDVKGYEGIYKVSNKGYIRSLDRIDEGGRSIKGRIMKFKKRTLQKNQNRESMNHNTVSLYKGGIEKGTVSVGRLVLTAFDRPPKEKEIVVYKDDNATNERIENLEWGYSTGLRGYMVLEIKELVEDGEFDLNQIAEAYNISKNTVNRVLDGEYGVH